MTPRIRRAIAAQARIAARVERRDRIGRIRLVGGADASFRNGFAYAAIVVLDAQTLDVVECATARARIRFPYVPGLLAFREMPVLRAAWGRLHVRPDLLLLDGHGLAHPRRCGLACHAGVEFDVPAIGVAKSLLYGTAQEPERRRGAWAPILDGRQVIGAAVRTRDGVRPVYVSIGHRVSLPTAVRWVLRLARSRIPEPTRRADRISRSLEANAVHL